MTYEICQAENRMQTRKKNFSVLGFGCMRLPKKGTGFDFDECEREIMHAVKCGVNYFDTAYIYGGNEELLGRVLEKNNVRSKVNIATKIPHYYIHSLKDIEKYFDISLSRLRTDYIDNLLIHMLPDTDVWNRLKSYGIEKWIEDKKKSGKIRNIGFSFHGNSPAFIELLDAYPWDFCQCQYNYLDENTQAGRKGVEHAAALGIPVVIMEPLRGGRLVNALPPKAKKLFRENIPGWKIADAERAENAGRTADAENAENAGRTADAENAENAGRTADAENAENAGRTADAENAENAGKIASCSRRAPGGRVPAAPASPAEWGLRWLYDQPEISVILSGMNSMEMLDENIRIADEARVHSFTGADFAVIEKVKAAINEKMKVACTGCGYCMPCPHGVDIPGCFRCYNERYTDSYGKSMKEYLMTTAFRAKKSYASLCVGCGRCEKLCPQSIPIRAKLREASHHLEGPVFHCAEFFSRGMFRAGSKKNPES